MNLRKALFSLILSLLVILATTQLVLAQSVLNASHDLVTLGIATTNMVPNSPTLDSSPLLSKAVAYANSHSVATVTVDKGSYYFLTTTASDSHVVFNQVQNVTVDLNGSDLYLAKPQWVGLKASQCTNFTLQNFTIDYSDLPFTQVKVTSVDPVKRILTYSTSSGYKNASALNGNHNPYGLTEHLYVFVYRNGYPAPNVARLEAVEPVSDTQLTFVDDKTPMTASTVLQNIRVGDTAVISDRGAGEPVNAYVCSKCTFRNIKVYSSGINGVSLTYADNTTVDHVYVMPRPNTDRLISSNADGITLSMPRGNDTVTLSRAIRTLDDGFSPHALLLGIVTSQPDVRHVVVQRQFSDIIDNGSPITFQSVADGSILGIASIVSQSPVPTFFAVANESDTVTLDRDVTANMVGAVVYTTDAAQRGANTFLDRDTVQEQGFARGITLWGLMNSTVSGTYIRHAAATGIWGVQKLVTGDWFSPPVVGLTLSRNVIDGTSTLFGGGIQEQFAAVQMLALQSNSQPMSMSPHQNITISDNFIVDPARSGIRIQNTTTAAATSNYVLHANNWPYRDGYFEDTFQPYQSEFLQPFVSKTSTNVTNDGTVSDRLTGRVVVSDQQFNLLAAYAPGQVIRLNGVQIGSLANASVVIQGSDGTRQTAKIAGSSANAIDVTLPSNTALGAATVTLTSDNGNFFGTMFVDAVDNVSVVNGCTYDFAPAAGMASASAGSYQILVVTQAGCAYGTADADSFVTVSSGGTGVGIVTLQFTANTGASRVTAVEIAGQQIPVTQSAIIPQNGWWWDSKLSGMGFYIENGGISGSGMFLAGFLYDASGNATWLASTGAYTPATATYANNWLKVIGGQTLAGPYAAPTGSSNAGSLTLVFSSPTQAVMTRPDGTKINLSRFSFTTTPPTPPQGGTAQVGWWWAGSALSGTGYGIEFQGNNVFIVAYVYDSTGNPVWYLATGALSSPSTYTGSWDKYAGGPQLTSAEGGSFSTHLVSGQSVPMSLTFSDPTHGTLTMGSVSFPIVRFQSF